MDGLKPGMTFGPYEIIRLLGKGGMGEVYEARHSTLDRLFALKLISRELLDDAGSRERFIEEARETCRLEHPRIVKVDHYDVVEGQPYLRMELVTGVIPGVSNNERRVASLETLILARGGNLLEIEALIIIRDVLEALCYAHNEGVIHRDIKPANILLYEENGLIRAKLGDFGLVKAIGEDFIQSKIRHSVSKSRVLSTGSPHGRSKDGLDSRDLSYVGTYDYMAPEQKDGLQATVKSDLYAVGLIAYRMLTGKKALGMRSVTQMTVGLNTAWDDFVAIGTEPDPKERFGDAAEMIKALPLLRFKSIKFESHKKRVKSRAFKKVLGIFAISVFAILGWQFYDRISFIQDEEEDLRAEVEMALEKGDLEFAASLLNRMEERGFETGHYMDRLNELANRQHAREAVELALEKGDLEHVAILLNNMQERGFETGHYMDRLNELVNRQHAMEAEDRARNIKESTRTIIETDGEGMLSQWEALQSEWQLGQSCMNGESWGEALRSFERFIQMAEKFPSMVEQRRVARLERDEVVLSRGKGSLLNAPQYATGLWSEAYSSEQKAIALFDAGDFRASRDEWTRSKSLYEQAIGLANDAIAFIQMEVEWREALELADIAIIRQYVPNKLDEIMQLAENAINTWRLHPQAGTENLREALKLLKDSEIEATDLSGPTLALKVLVDGQIVERVPARINQQPLGLEMERRFDRGTTRAIVEVGPWRWGDINYGIIRREVNLEPGRQVIRISLDEARMPQGGDPRAVEWLAIGDNLVRNHYQNGDVTIIDLQTGLMWKFDAGAMGRANWEQAQILCNQLFYAGYGNWRLPTIEQLESIASAKQYFQHVQADIYWSRTVFAESGNFARYLNMSFENPRPFHGTRRAEYWIWPCRVFSSRPLR